MIPFNLLPQTLVTHITRTICIATTSRNNLTSYREYNELEIMYNAYIALVMLCILDKGMKLLFECDHVPVVLIPLMV